MGSWAWLARWSAISLTSCCRSGSTALRRLQLEALIVTTSARQPLPRAFFAGAAAFFATAPFFGDLAFLGEAAEIGLVSLARSRRRRSPLAFGFAAGFRATFFGGLADAAATGDAGAALVVASLAAAFFLVAGAFLAAGFFGDALGLATLPASAPSTAAIERRAKRYLWRRAPSSWAPKRTTRLLARRQPVRRPSSPASSWSPPLSARSSSSSSFSSPARSSFSATPPSPTSCC